MRKIILLSGAPGSGKTTLLHSVLPRLSQPASGFYTQEIRQGGIRQGFELVTLDEQRGVLAHVNLRRPLRIGKYGVDLSVMDRLGVLAMLQFAKGGGLVVIDEIGPMEILSEPFRQAVLHLLDGPASLLATVAQCSIPFTDQVKSTPGALLLEVTPRNRESLPGQILAALQEP